MVDLGGGPEGPIEHGFSNKVFILPALIVVSLSGETYLKYTSFSILHTSVT